MTAARIISTVGGEGRPACPVNAGFAKRELISRQMGWNIQHNEAEAA